MELLLTEVVGVHMVALGRDFISDMAGSAGGADQNGSLLDLGEVVKVGGILLAVHPLLKSSHYGNYTNESNYHISAFFRLR